MTDITDLQKEIRQLEESLARDLEGLQKKDPSQRAKQINRCSNKVIEIRTRLEAYELEILQLDKYSQITHKEAMQELQTRFKELKSLFERRKLERADDGAAARTAIQEDLEKNLDDLTGQELIKVGDDTQKKGMDALRRVLGDIQRADQKADDINLEFARQDEVIARSKDKAKDVQTQLKRANQYLRYFAKQVQTDKLILCLIVLCIIAIIVIIGLKIAKSGDGDSKDNDVISKITKN